MKAVFFILNDSDKITELLTALNTSGICGATIFNAGGMGGELSKIDDFNQSFGILRRFIQGTKQEHKVLMFVIKEEKLPLLTRTIESVVGDLSDVGTGLLFSLPIDYIKGLKY